MNGVHDLGGMHGFGPVEREEHGWPFHAAWEARVQAMALMLVRRGYYSVHAFRHGIERMAPADYLRAVYHERWLATVERNLADLGLLGDGEVEARLASLRDHPGADPAPAPAVAIPELAAGEELGPLPAPRFAVGDAVVARNIHPAGHTRLPRYARSKRGVIQAVRGAQVFPDTDAHGLGEHRHTVYSVRFAGRELWGDVPDTPTAVYLDLWERYLEPAPAWGAP